MQFKALYGPYIHILYIYMYIFIIINIFELCKQVLSHIHVWFTSTQYKDFKQLKVTRLKYSDTSSICHKILLRHQNAFKVCLANHVMKVVFNFAEDQELLSRSEEIEELWARSVASSWASQKAASWILMLGWLENSF